MPPLPQRQGKEIDGDTYIYHPSHPTCVRALVARSAVFWRAAHSVTTVRSLWISALAFPLLIIKGSVYIKPINQSIDQSVQKESNDKAPPIPSTTHTNTKQNKALDHTRRLRVAEQRGGVSNPADPAARSNGTAATAAAASQGQSFIIDYTIH